MEKSLKSWTRNTGLDHPWFPTDALDGILELSPEMTQLDTAKVTPLNAFQPLPQTLVRGQSRGISGQALQRIAWHTRLMCAG